MWKYPGFIPVKINKKNPFFSELLFLFSRFLKAEGDKMWKCTPRPDKGLVLQMGQSKDKEAEE